MSRYVLGPTTIRFFDDNLPNARSVKELDVDVPVDLVVDATWAGDDIALRLASTTKDEQSAWARSSFWEHYNPDVGLVTRIIDETPQGTKTARWLYHLNQDVIGENNIEDKLKELSRKHNSEILRIQRLGLT